MAAPWDTNPGWSDSTPVAETGSGVVFGTPGDGKVPTWNAATGRLEWATPSGGSSAVPLADPTLTTDSDTYDNPVTGSGKITTVVATSETVALAVAMEGDAFPRILLTTDGTDALYLGDGTFDPYAAGAGLVFNGESVKVFGTSGAGGTALYANGDVIVGHLGSGVVLVAPDSSQHRLLVANDGTLSTEPV